jgi:hypothetical protein
VKQSFTFSCGLLAKLSAAILALFCKKRELESLQNPENFSGETNNNENSFARKFFFFFFLSFFPVSSSKQGLPDLSCYNIPKLGKFTKIYRMAVI